PPIRRDPYVVAEALRLRRQETALAEDQVPEELVVRGLRDPPLRSVPRHVRFDLPPEMGFPLAAIQPRAFVFRDVVAYRLQACSAHHVVVLALRPPLVDVL